MSLTQENKTSKHSLQARQFSVSEKIQGYRISRQRFLRYPGRDNDNYLPRGSLVTGAYNYANELHKLHTALKSK